MRTNISKPIALVWLVLIQWVLAWEWLHASWGKVTGSEFMDSIGATLGFFASAKNTHTSYAHWLHDHAVPHAQLFGNMVRFSELLIGLALALGGLWVLCGWRWARAIDALLVLGLYLAALLNLNLYLAAGFTGPGTAGQNVVMGLIELVLGTFYLQRTLGRA